MRRTDGLRDEYASLFASCVVRPDKPAEVDPAVARMLAHRARYQAVTVRKACRGR